jgi:hypothetical protein
MLVELGSAHGRMHRLGFESRRRTFVSVILVLGLVFPGPAGAQTTASTLSGTVKGPSGTVVANAKVAIKSVATGQIAETQSDSGGHYSLADVKPGDYEVSVSAEGLGTITTLVSVATGANATADVTLDRGLSLSDLGFSPDQTQGSAQDQARLNKRSHMLMLHQRFGLIATIPMIATLATSINAGGKNTSSTDRNLHVALGAVTGDLYGISAYYAIRAPKIQGTETRGPIRLHKILAWIHGPGMIMTPILGAIAFDQKNSGEKVHGIAKAHGPVAIVTAAAYGAAILSVSFKF